MKKGCLIAAFCTAAAGIVLLTSLFWRPFLFSGLDIALICADQYDSNQVCQVNSTFIIPRTAEKPSYFNVSAHEILWYDAKP